MKVKNLNAKLFIVCFCMVFIGLMLAGQSFAKVDLGKAVGIWTFDDGAGDIAKDSSANGNDGKLVKGPKWVAGKYGKALEFSGGGDYVDCGNAKSFDITDSITIVAWVKSSDQAFAHQDFVGKPSAYILGHMDPPGPTVRCYINNGGWVGADYSKPFASYVDTWVYFAFTYDLAKLRIFVDGAVDKEVPCAGKISVNANQVVIAHSSESQGFAAFFKGVIDEVAIFNLALSDADIKELMNMSLTGKLAVSPSSKLATAWAMVKSK
jgi:hypothetical protein